MQLPILFLYHSLHCLPIKLLLLISESTIGLVAALEHSSLDLFEKEGLGGEQHFDLFIELDVLLDELSRHVLEFHLGVGLGLGLLDESVDADPESAGGGDVVAHLVDHEGEADDQVDDG